MATGTKLRGKWARQWTVFALVPLLAVFLGAGSTGWSMDYQIDSSLPGNDPSAGKFQSLQDFIIGIALGQTSQPGGITLTDGDSIILSNADDTLAVQFHLGTNINVGDLTFKSATDGTQFTISPGTGMSENPGGGGGAFIHIHGPRDGEGDAANTGYTLKDLIFDNWKMVGTNDDPDRGGAVAFIRFSEDISVEHTDFSNNSVETQFAGTDDNTKKQYGGGGGGAVFLRGTDNASFENVTFDSNSVTTVTEATRNAGGGAIYLLQNDNTTFTDTTFTGNTVEATGENSGGGAVYALSADNVEYNNGVFGGGNISDGNTVTSDSQDVHGGALYAKDSDITFNSANNGPGNDGTHFDNNSVSTSGGNAYGGALYADQSSIQFTTDGDTNTKLTFTDNTATSTATGGNAYGGAIYYKGKEMDGVAEGLEIAGASFTSNQANGTVLAVGGAIFTATGNNDYDADLFDGNSAYGESAIGGAIASVGNDTVTNSEFSNNQALGTRGTDDANASGGAISWDGGKNSVTAAEPASEIERKKFFNNEALAEPASDKTAYAVGGAIATGGGEFDTSGYLYDDNRASAYADNGTAIAGGGALALGGGTAVIGADVGRTVFNGNTAKADSTGGAAVAGGGAIAFVNRAAAGDMTDPDQIGLSGSLTVKNSTFGKNSSGINNTAEGKNLAMGGAILSAAETTKITDSDFAGSRAEATDASLGVAMGGANAILGGNAEITGNTYLGSTADGATAMGGAVFYDGSDVENESLTITNTTFGSTTAGEENQAKSDATANGVAAGGAVYSQGAKNEISGSTFTNNSANAILDSSTGRATGGAIHVENKVIDPDDLTLVDGDATLSVAGTTFTGNNARGNGNASGTGEYGAYGGAIYTNAVDNKITGYQANAGDPITRSTFADNYAEGTGDARGGALYATGGKNSVENTDFSGNHAGISLDTYHGNNVWLADEATGGAIHVDGGAETTIATSDFTGNYSIGKIAQGGAIYSNAEATTINGAADGSTGIFSGNRAYGATAAEGGAYYAAAGDTTIKNATFDDNMAGGLYDSASNGTLVTQHAKGGHNYLAGDDIIEGNTYTNGSAIATDTAQGGAINSTGTSLTVTGSTFGELDNVTGNPVNGNFAQAKEAAGGAIYMAGDVDTTGDDYSATITDSDFYDNIADAKVTDGTSARGGAVFLGEKIDASVDGATFISNQALTNSPGDTTAQGGAIYSAGDNLVISDTTFGDSTDNSLGNKVSGSFATGGAVYMAGDETAMESLTVAMDGTGFYGNGAVGTPKWYDGTAAGGAYYAGENVNSTLNDVIFTNNSAISIVSSSAGGNATGGAIYNANGDLTITGDSTFSGNIAEGNSGAGGAIWSLDGSTTIKNATFSDNRAGYEVSDYATGNSSSMMFGGHAGQTQGSYSSSESTYIGGQANATQAFGGAISFFGSTVTDPDDDTVIADKLIINGDTFGGDIAGEGNTANGYYNARGGAIYSMGGENSITDSSFIGNKAGGKYTSASGDEDTRLATGGAIHIDDGIGQITDTTFKRNTVYGKTASGGAIYSDTTGLTVAGGDFDSNLAEAVDGAATGAAIHNESGTLVIKTNGDTGATLTNNRATGTTSGQGGAVWTGGNALNVSDATFGDSTDDTMGNQALGVMAAGGAIYVADNAAAAVANITNSKFYNSQAGVNATTADARGGAYYAGNNVESVITNATFSGSSASTTGAAGTVARGGAVYSGDGDTTVQDGNFAQNTATAHEALGGAIYNEDGNLAVGKNTGTGTVFVENTADGISLGQGGAVWTGGDSLTVDGATFGAYDSGTEAASNGNIASGEKADGGAIYIQGDNSIPSTDPNLTATVNNSNFYGNQATASGNFARGGAVYLGSNTDGEISGSDFIGNRVSSTDIAQGGAVYVNDGDISVTSGTFADNTAMAASSHGGAIYMEGMTADTTAAIANATFTNNKVGDGTGQNARGGAVMAGNLTDTTIDNSIFTGNQAKATMGSGGTAHGGAVTSILGDLTVSDGAFYNNLAQGYLAHGGALYNASGDVVIGKNSGNGATFTGNSVEGTQSGYGGALYAGGENLTVDNARFGNASDDTQGNKAHGTTAAGGAIYMAGNLGNNESTITNTEFYNNQAGDGTTTTNASGGAYYAGNDVISTLDTVTLSGNQALGTTSAFGGAIYHRDNLSIVATGSYWNSFTGNAATSDTSAAGGAIHSVATGADALAVAKTNFGTYNSSTGTASDGNTATAANAEGGAVYMDGSAGVATAAAFDQTGFYGNTAEATSGQARGGAYFANEDVMTSITGSAAGYSGFVGNTATGTTAAAGGAIYSLATGSDALAVDYTSFGTQYNSATGVGNGNTATAATATGGAVHMAGSGSTASTVTFGQSNFFGNTADATTGDAMGGAYYAGDRVNSTISGTVFVGNKAVAVGDAFGGAIYNQNGTLSIDGAGTTSIRDNLANGYNAHGGGIYSTGDVSLVDEHVSNNQAQASGGIAMGGGVAVEGTTNANLTVSDSVVSDNEAIGAQEGIGGGLAIISNGVLTVTGTSDSDRTYVQTNTAQGGDFAAGGGIAIGLDASSSTFDFVNVVNNTAEATNPNCTAKGGGINNANVNNDLVLTNTNVTGNNAKAGEYAYGGGISNVGVDTINPGSNALTHTNGSISNNTVTATDADGKALGGGIYNDQGTVSLTDVDVTGNKANGYTARGAGVYMNSEGDAGTDPDSILNLAVGANSTMNVNQNTATSGDGYGSTDIFFGAEDPLASTTTNAMLNVNTDASRTMNLGSVGTDLNNSDYTETKLGTGTQVRTGANYYHVDGGNTTLDFNRGESVLKGDYQGVFTGSGDASVNLGAAHTTVFGLSNPDRVLPVWNFQNTGTRKLSADTGSMIDVDYIGSGGNRLVYSADKTVIVARGLAAGYLTAPSELDGVVFNPNNPYFKYRDFTGFQQLDNGDIVFGIRFDSPFEHAGVNTRNAVYSGALSQLFDHMTNPGLGNYLVDDNEYGAMLSNPWSLHPELYVDQGLVMVDAVGMAADTAMNIGLRNPYRASLRMGAVPPSRYGAGGRLDDRYYPVISNGLRIWASYIGDFGRNKQSGGHIGYKTDRNGILIGMNYDFGSTATIGFFGGYSHAETKARRTSAKIKQDAGHFGIQGRLSPMAMAPQFSLFGDIGYHFGSNDLSRSYSGYGAKDSFNQHVYTMGLGAEYVFSFGYFNLTPFAKLRLSHLNQKSLNESGTSSTTTNAKSFSKTPLTHHLGVEASYDFAFASGVVSPNVTVAWQHNYGSRHYSTTGYYNKVTSQPAIGYNLKSSKRPADLLNLGVGATSTFKVGRDNELGFGIGANLKLGSDVRDFSIFANVSIGF